jgi:hypothetical protein
MTRGGRLAVLTAVGGAVWLATAPIAAALWGRGGTSASLVAAAVCWAAGAAALAVYALPGLSPAVRLWAPMTLRLLLTLAAGGILAAVGAAPAAAFWPCLILYYQTTLAVETWLVLPDLRPARGRSE